MSLAPVLLRLTERRDLSQGEAKELMGRLSEGTADPVQVAGVLAALQTKGVTAQELAGFAAELRERSMSLATSHPHLVDTCGTGGGVATFNLSTGAALVAAAAGAKVAKHGNRSVTSHCGSADVLEALGVRLDSDPERLARLLDEVGIVFLFAPHHHPSMKAVGPVRKALGVRTVFNLLGPLANPAGAKRQLVGVYDRAFVRPMAEALLLLGAEEAYVVHGSDGMDEVSPCAETFFAHVSGGNVDEGGWTPESFGMTSVTPDVLAPGDTVESSAAVLRSALAGSERSSALVPNAAVALWLAGMADSVLACADLARDVLASGRAEQKLLQLAEATSL